MRTQNRLLPLDSLRGIFAIMIVLLHSAVDWHFLNSSMIRNSYIGVPFFFTLSGFVVAKSHGHRLKNAADFARFMVLRIGRLWPLHAFMMALFLAYYGGMYAIRGRGPFGSESPYETDWIWAWNAREVLFLNAFTNEGHFFGNFPAWSINAEFWTYVAFGAIFFAFSKPVLKYASTAALAIVALAVISGLITPPFGAAWGWALFKALFFFGCGIGALHTWRSGALAGVLGNTAAEVALIACWGVLLLKPAFLPSGVLPMALVASLLLVSFAHGRGAVSRLLSARPFVRLGELSYSIYLTHIFVFSVISTALRETGLVGQCQRLVGEDQATVLCAGSQWQMDALVIAFVATVIAVSHLTYAWIEVPGQKVARTIAGRLKICNSTGEKPMEADQ